MLASPQSAPGNLDNSKSGEIKGNGSGGSRENSTVDFSKVIVWAAIYISWSFLLGKLLASVVLLTLVRVVF